MSHTPAPWAILFDGCTNTIVAEENVVADLITQDDDAYLIAAAPDMLAALKDARAFMCEVMAQRGNNGVSILIKAADAAIARAEGRS